MKCEVEGCNTDTKNFLCEAHTKIAQSKNARFKICKNCNTIVEVRIKEDQKIKYTFVKECSTCNFK